MKVGILTMHKVVNYGSALQAYALQRFLTDNRIKSEIIDYIFTNKPHGIKNWIRYIVKCDFLKDIKFRAFWRENYILSKRSFSQRNELTEDKCKYDIYLTGSDQVWNPNHEGFELTFMFDFIKSPIAKKISYASSFSTCVIPEIYKAKYRELLSKYSSISVREGNALHLIKELTGENATWVCDPTLLLSKEIWKDLGNRAKIRIKQPYILFYILTYAYNPYPEIEKIIHQIQKQFPGKKYVFLNGKVTDRKRLNSIVINNVSPYDFISLIERAEFIVTTSFHGTAFAVNFRKPFYSIIQSDLTLDDRMYSLLDKVGLKKRAICYDKEMNFENMEYISDVESKIKDFTDISKKYLLNSLNSL